MGDEQYRERLLEGATAAELSGLWKDEQREFENLVREFRIY
jgi:hypothetical protein